MQSQIVLILYAYFLHQCKVIWYIMQKMIGSSLNIRMIDSKDEINSSINVAWPEQVISVHSDSIKIASLLFNISAIHEILSKFIFSVLFDPSCIYGHREFETSLDEVEGGFHHHYHMEYRRCVPRVKGWEERSQLYCLFVHTLIWNHENNATTAENAETAVMDMKKLIEEKMKWFLLTPYHYFFIFLLKNNNKKTFVWFLWKKATSAKNTDNTPGYENIII